MLAPVSKREPLDPSLGDHFSRRGSLEAGASLGRLRARDLRSEFRGSRSRVKEVVPAADRYLGELIALRDRCAAYQPVAPAGFAFSHATAAALHGIPLPDAVRLNPELHVTVPVGSRAPRRPGVVGHTADVVVRPGVLPIVEPATAWLQVAAILTVDQLVVAGDYLVRRKRPLSSFAELHLAVERAVHVRGIRAARAALVDIRGDTDSPPESELRLCLVRAGLPEPVVHYEVHDDDGFFVGTPDLAYVRERIALEYQGLGHREDADVFEDDIIRREMFLRAGWHVLLVTSARLQRPRMLVAEVAALLRDRAAH